jgi:hypothetical protein
MQRDLSVRSTGVLKFAGPPVWVAVVAYAAWSLWTDTPNAVDSYSATQSLAVRVLLIGLIAVSLIVMFAFVIPLKRVRLVTDGLHVSNGIREITVPFDAILSVRQDWLPTFRLVTLKLRPGRGLPSRVIFMPAGSRRFAFWRREYWREDALVGELRRLAGLAA